MPIKNKLKVPKMFDNNVQSTLCLDCDCDMIDECCDCMFDSTNKKAFYEWLKRVTHG